MYAVWLSSRSAFVRTAWMGRGVGGRGRLNDDGIGFAVDAYEYVGDAGTGGSLLGVGEGERDRTGEDMFVVCLLPTSDRSKQIL